MRKCHEAWEEVAKEFARLVELDAHRKFILDPATKKMIFNSSLIFGGLKDKNILDAGCGEGTLARFLNNKGASILGIDFSQNMIEIAKSRIPRNSNLKFERINLLKPLPYPSSSFDLIICSMVLMGMPKVSATLREFKRVLKEGGELIISISHPSYSTPFVKIKRRVADVILGREAPIQILDYPMRAKVYKKIFGLNKKMPYFHRRISFYFNKLAGNGFDILEVQEPTMPERYKRIFPRLAHTAKIPVFLLFRCKK